MRRGVLETVISGRKTRTSHAQVVDELGRAIIAGEYPVGATLPGDLDLAQRFKVSRTVLREAMKTLAAKGLIVPRARIGTRVTPKNQWNLFDGDVLTWHFHKGVDLEFLTHLSEIRLAFEPAAASLAATNATDEDVKQLYTLAAEMSESTHTPETLALADLKFHLCVAEASRNPFMRTVGSLIEAALVGVFKLSSPASGESRREEVSEAHTRIVDAIAAHDVDGAAEAMRKVIITGRERVKVALEEH
ncbi:FadR family transcriptional regulator [Rhizobium sp. KVB221]|uniref:FadR family transcriptional regulator n=1 Tax=Rhizobium setariae TaxID=2801340 RepID=A0A937CPA7_9HYPH|nr:FadR/GntR family transcriptional regulator [Rhizobium setariae]MBL0372984.1 FadR family transcriptional regulator [Rhizobium setariae]